MKYIYLVLIMVLSLMSCQNADWEFSDFDYSTVYFSYQYPIRTLTMGEDQWDTTLDNEHKCKIFATWGGGYSNKKDVYVKVEIDNSLCNNIKFDNNRQIKAMPSNYYSLLSKEIKIEKGTVAGGIEVQFTDDFFNDPLALDLNYVIPLVIESVQNADSVLRGASSLDNPRRCFKEDWSVLPKDYILYAVKYINTWDATYLRRGKDVITQNGNTETIIRHQANVESDEIYKSCATLSLTKLEYPVTYKDGNGNDVTVNLELTFDESTNKCTISSRTAGVTASGSGEFKKKSEIKAWGNKDRDALYLDYTVDTGAMQCSTKDTLVVRDRAVIAESFSLVYE